MRLSVVSTLYNSKPFLQKFLVETIKAIDTLGITDYEIIFVNDGSPDDSLVYLLERKKEIHQIKLVDLSRNFGHHYAIQAGLHHAKGEYVFLIDNDMEVHPGILVDFYNEMESNSQYDVVYGYQDRRKGGFLERVAGKFFWKALNAIAEVKIPENVLTERLMTKNYVLNLLTLQDSNLFLAGMMHWVGFNQKGVPVKKSHREGPSTYSLKKRLTLMVQAITSFSGKPLEYLFYFGISVSVFSFLFLIYLIIKKIYFGPAIQLGWTSIVAINILILGILSTFLGLIGTYLFKVFRQVQGRPNYIIQKAYE